jgi:two-component system phosphate regulon sensor histidine kinase PhoR
LRNIADSNAKLNDEREKVEFILSNMAEGFVFVDGKKSILLCNSSARDFFSVGKDVRLESIYSLTRNKSISAALQSALYKKQSTVFELELRQGLTTNIYVSPSVTADSQFGATMLIVDTTQIKTLERQKREFFSNASHELKTPITSIMGFSEMLNKNIVTDEGERSAIMQRIETEARRLTQLIGDILTISKLESNEAGAENKDFSLTETVREAVSAVSPVLGDTAIEIRTELEDIPYRGDKRQLYELCVNLVENAVKYNRANGRVDITLKKQDGSAVLTVTDTGIGIPPEFQARVFERFFRVDYGRDKSVGGTGLGLAIVKHIVSLYGGRISLQSAKDEGTSIAVSLPCH